LPLAAPPPAVTQLTGVAGAFPSSSRSTLAERVARTLRADRKRLVHARHPRTAAIRALRRVMALRREAAREPGTLAIRRALELQRRGLARYRAGDSRAGRRLLARAAAAAARAR
jgi:hypothetical protein